MEIIKLSAQFREEVGGNMKSLREKGLTPAVIYGHGFETKNLVVEHVPFQKVYRKAGENSLVDLEIGGKESVKVLIQDVQKNALSGQIIHVDFRQIKMTEKLEADIPLNFIGESRAIKELNGILVKNIDALSIKCLPAVLVPQIDIDLSSLREFGDVIRASDISLPEGMELIEEPESVVVIVAEPRSEKEIQEAEKSVEDISKVEVVGKEEEVGSEQVEEKNK